MVVSRKGAGLYQLEDLNGRRFARLTPGRQLIKFYPRDEEGAPDVEVVLWDDESSGDDDSSARRG
jgi:hypothetical protein